MPEPPTRPPDPEPDRSPLIDPDRWDELIEGVRPASCLVIIGSSMSKSLREHCAPEDIWQETLAQAWSARKQHQWQGKAAFRAWLFEIARNRIRDAVRRIETEKRGGGRAEQRFVAPASEPASSDLDLQPPDSVTPSRIAMHAERAAAMQRALAALPPEVEPIVRLHLLEEVTMEEVARQLGISVSSAWRRFRRGVELYSKAMSDWSGGSSSSF